MPHSVQQLLSQCAEMHAGNLHIEKRTVFANSDLRKKAHWRVHVDKLSMEEYFDAVIGDVFGRYSTKIHFMPVGSLEAVCGREFCTYTAHTKVFEMAYEDGRSKYFCTRCMKSWDKMGRNFDNPKGGMIALRGFGGV